MSKKDKKKVKDEAAVDIKTRVFKDRVLKGRPLGRVVRHDPRSWNYPAPRATRIKSVLHKRHGLPFNQGEFLGCCTGNAVAGLLMTDPFFNPARRLDEEDAVRLYSRATHLKNESETSRRSTERRPMLLYVFAQQFGPR